MSTRCTPPATPAAQRSARQRSARRSTTSTARTYSVPICRSRWAQCWSFGSLLRPLRVAVKDAERNADLIGSEMTFFVFNGTSTANQIVAHSQRSSPEMSSRRPQLPQVGQLRLDVTDAIPVYLCRRATVTGSSGRSLRRGSRPKPIADTVATSPLTNNAAEMTPVYAVVTNSTYDGLCYAPIGWSRSSESCPEGALRRSVVRLSALSPAVRQSICHARPEAGTSGPDDLRHSVDPQAPRPPSRRPR